MKSNNAVMHYSFTVKDLKSTRRFYIDLLGCQEGRSTDTWVDFDFFGNQLSAHISEKNINLDYCGFVDDISVPLPHFGAILSTDTFNTIKETLISKKQEFIIEPTTRYKGSVGEQKIMFFLDPSGNAIELKSFSNDEEIFKEQKKQTVSSKT